MNWGAGDESGSQGSGVLVARSEPCVPYVPFAINTTSFFTICGFRFFFTICEYLCSN